MFDAVLFDCDGVLVDSEPITNGVLREVLNESGWALTQAECMQIFIGKAVRDERARIEAETGKPFTEDWLQAFYARRNVRLLAELQAVQGAVEAVTAIHQHVAGRIACASGADHPNPPTAPSSTPDGRPHVGGSGVVWRFVARRRRCSRDAQMRVPRSTTSKTELPM